MILQKGAGCSQKGHIDGLCVLDLNAANENVKSTPQRMGPPEDPDAICLYLCPSCDTARTIRNAANTAGIDQYEFAAKQFAKERMIQVRKYRSRWWVGALVDPRVIGDGDKPELYAKEAS